MYLPICEVSMKNYLLFWRHTYFFPLTTKAAWGDWFRHGCLKWGTRHATVCLQHLRWALLLQILTNSMWENIFQWLHKVLNRVLSTPNLFFFVPETQSLNSVSVVLNIFVICYIEHLDEVITLENPKENKTTKRHNSTLLQFWKPCV